MDMIATMKTNFSHKEIDREREREDIEKRAGILSPMFSFVERKKGF